MFTGGMGKLLDRLLKGARAYSVMKDTGGYLLVARPGHLAEFSALVGEALDHAGGDFVVFPVGDGGDRYSQMFVIPLDEPPTRSS